MHERLDIIYQNLKHQVKKNVIGVLIVTAWVKRKEKRKYNSASWVFPRWN